MKIEVSSININSVIVEGRHRKDLGDIQSLANSIKEIGLLHPIVICKGKLVAGERRLAAFKLLNSEGGRDYIQIPAHYAENFEQAAQLLKAEHDENICRKDFTPSEAYSLGQLLEPIERAEAQERESQGRPKEGRENFTTLSKGKTADKVGAAVGMSGKTYSKVKDVMEYALEMKMPELVTLMDEQSVDAANKEMKAGKRAAEREQKLKNAPTETKYIGNFETGNLYVADVTTGEFVSSLPSESIDLIVTDPPWDKDALRCYKAAEQIAMRVLKPGKLMAIYAGKMFLPEIYKILLAHELEYVWEFCVFQPDSNDKIQKHHLFSAWRPVILVRKKGGKIEMPWIPDAIKSTRDKRYHEWGQGIEMVERLVNAYSQPNEIVLDPFIGGASVPYVAKNSKRQYIGFDISAETIRLGLLRMNETTI